MLKLNKDVIQARSAYEVDLLLGRLVEEVGCSHASVERILQFLLRDEIRLDYKNLPLFKWFANIIFIVQQPQNSFLCSIRSATSGDHLGLELDPFRLDHPTSLTWFYFV